MADDVFGRPMDETPTAFPVRRNLAPNPLEGDPGMSAPFAGARPPFGPYPPIGRLFSEEQLGAQQAITAPQPQTSAAGPMSAPTWDSPGGSVIPPATHRPETPAMPGGSDKVFSDDLEVR